MFGYNVVEKKQAIEELGVAIADRDRHHCPH
jgi:hypothetical protein